MVLLLVQSPVTPDRGWLKKILRMLVVVVFDWVCCVSLHYRLASNSGVPGGNYFILLILTDGIITDMQQTCDAIVNVSAASTTATTTVLLDCTTISSQCKMWQRGW